MRLKIPLVGAGVLLLVTMPLSLTKGQSGDSVRLGITEACAAEHDCCFMPSSVCLLDGEVLINKRTVFGRCEVE